MDCFVAFAPRNDGLDMHPHSRGADRPRFALNLPPSPRRGRRKGRVHAAPAVSRANRTENDAHEHTGSAEAARPSLRNGFTAYNALSLATGFLATIARRYLCELDTSIGVSEPHDFTVRLSH